MSIVIKSLTWPDPKRQLNLARPQTPMALRTDSPGQGQDDAGVPAGDSGGIVCFGGAIYLVLGEAVFQQAANSGFSLVDECCI